jgi:hypothetical protein
MFRRPRVDELSGPGGVPAFLADSLVAHVAAERCGA